MIRFVVMVFGLLANSAAAQGLSAARMVDIHGGAQVILGIDAPMTHDLLQLQEGAPDIPAQIACLERAVPDVRSPAQVRDSAGTFTARLASATRDNVMTAPNFQNQSAAANGTISDLFLRAERLEFAHLLRREPRPDGARILYQQSVDGSDPSAGFCP